MFCGFLIRLFVGFKICVGFCCGSDNDMWWRILFKYILWMCFLLEIFGKILLKFEYVFNFDISRIYSGNFIEEMNVMFVG